MNATLRQQAKPCMKSCRAEPFLFSSWESSVAWITCNYLVQDCENIPVPEMLTPFTDIQNALSYHASVAKSQDADLWNGFQFCFFLTLGQLLPYAFVLIGLVYSLVQLLLLPVVLFSSGMQFTWQAIAYTHVD